jgi:predicted acetyltransferase
VQTGNNRSAGLSCFLARYVPSAMSQVSVRDSRAARDDRRWIEGVYREYLNDLAGSATGLFPSLGEVGHREPDQLLRWFSDNAANILTVLYGPERVGFAMVTVRPVRPAGGAVPGDQAPAPQYSFAEFFIGKPWRRRGIGAQAVRLILDRFAGQWLIREDLRNAAAVAFWRRIVSAYTEGKYQERTVNGEVHQRFQSAARRLTR